MAGTESSADHIVRTAALQDWAGRRTSTPEAIGTGAGIPPVPAELALDRLIREAASGGEATGHGPGDEHGPVPAGQPGQPGGDITPAGVLPATPDSLAGPSGVVTTRLPPHQDIAAAHPGLDPLAARIKTLLDEEARRHGIDV